MVSPAPQRFFPLFNPSWTQLSWAWPLEGVGHKGVAQTGAPTVAPQWEVSALQAKQVWDSLGLRHVLIHWAQKPHTLTITFILDDVFNAFLITQSIIFNSPCTLGRCKENCANWVFLRNAKVWEERREENEVNCISSMCCTLQTKGKRGFIKQEMSLEMTQKKSLLLGLRSGTVKRDERGEGAAGSVSQNKKENHSW